MQTQLSWESIWLTSKGSGVQISQSVRGGMGSFRYFQQTKDLCITKLLRLSSSPKRKRPTDDIKLSRIIREDYEGSIPPGPVGLRQVYQSKNFLQLRLEVCCSIWKKYQNNSVKSTAIDFILSARKTLNGGTLGFVV